MATKITIVDANKQSKVIGLVISLPPTKKKEKHLINFCSGGLLLENKGCTKNIVLKMLEERPKQDIHHWHVYNVLDKPCLKSARMEDQPKKCCLCVCVCGGGGGGSVVLCHVTSKECGMLVFMKPLTQPQ